MMISLKSEYGLLALADIAINSDGTPIQRTEIAERQRIPLPYLTQVLRTLVNGRLLESNRGPQGGYILNQQPGEISVLDVVNLLQGSVSPVNCAGVDEPGDCTRLGDCSLVGIWADLKTASEDVLRRTTLKDIIAGRSSGSAVADAPADPATEADTVVESDTGNGPADKLDCIGVPCPLPILRIAEKMRELQPGQVLEVWATDPGAKADIPAWCMGTGNEFVSREEFGDQMKFLIRKQV